MGFLEDFWENINAGATTIATAPDPIINIGRQRIEKLPRPTQKPLPPREDPRGQPDVPYGNTPANSTRSDQQIYDLIESYHGDDISLLHQHAEDFGVVQTKAKKHRDSIEGKVEGALTEHQVFWDEFGVLHDKHLDQEGRISEKAHADHTHPNGNGGGDCEFWDLGCHFGKSMEGLGKLALIGVVAFFIFMLIKKRLGL